MNNNNEYFKQYENDINNAWTKKLVAEFYIQNNIIWKNIRRELTMPNFAFSIDNAKWGEWSRSTKTLTLNYKLLRDFEWDAVVHTLKHEMAHIIVSELWNTISDNGDSHGELFDKACKILEADSKSTISREDLSDYRLPEQDAMISKVYKLFCLGESDHKAEAEAAIAKAHELMLKHNINLKDLPREKRAFIARPVGKIYVKVPQYIKVLSRIVSKYYYVKYIFYSMRDHSGLKRYVEFFGEPSSMDVAEYVYHFLMWEGERQWEEFQKSEVYQKRFEGNYYNGRYGERRSGKYSKVAFLTGLYNGFARTLQKRDEEIKLQLTAGVNTLPICVDDPLLEEKYENKYHPRTWGSSSGSRKSGYSEGASRGEAIRVRNGVASGVSNGRILLGA